MTYFLTYRSSCRITITQKARPHATSENLHFFYAKLPHHHHIPPLQTVLLPQRTQRGRNHSTHTWFFQASSGTGSPRASTSTRPGSSRWDSVGPKQRRSTSRSRTREQGEDRDAGDAHVGSSSSRRPLGAVGNSGGDWKASRRSLRLGESAMENSPSASRPSLPSTQEVSARKKRVSYSGRCPSFSGANTQARTRWAI